MIIPSEAALRKWSLKKQKSESLATMMLNSIDMTDNSEKTISERLRWERMRDCATRLEYQYCADCGSMHLARTNLCRDRLCAVCAWRLSMQRYAEMLHALNLIYEKNKYISAAMLTLTIRNCETSELRSTIKKLNSAFAKLRKRRIFQKYVIAYAKSIEITKNAKNNTYHPHAHVLLLFDKAYKKTYITQREWADMWTQCLNVDYTAIVDIRTAYCADVNVNKNVDNVTKFDATLKAALESCKYALKDNVLDESDVKSVNEISDALKDMRLISYGLELAAARRELKYKDEDRAVYDVDAAELSCPRCGNETLIDIVYEWAKSSYMPASDFTYQK